MNKISIILTVIIILVVTIVPATYQVIKKHQESLMIVSEKRIIEAYIKCVKEDKCNSNKEQLKVLEEKGYLEKEANPITKEYYHPNSYVEKNANGYSFIVIN